MRSFRHAWDGIVHAVKTERNMRIHLAAVYYVFVVGRLFRLHWLEWTLITPACGLVIGAELINTALERLCDGLEPGHSPVVKTVKDLAAGAVLVCAVAAVVIAVLVFLPRFPLEMDYMPRPAFWAGIGGLPIWIWFVFWFGRKKKER